MANTFTLIASSTVGAGGASSIDFTSIPSTYTDLCVVVSSRTTRSSAMANLGVKFNSSSSNLSSRILRALDVSSPDSYSNGTEIEFGSVGNTATASTFGSASIYIPNYAGSNNKSVSIDAVYEDNSANRFMYLVAGLWSNSSAITAVNLYTRDASTSFVQYSTAYLYGVKNA